MAATRTRSNSTAPAAAAEPGDLAELRAALQCIARVTAQTAAKCAHGQWSDFGKLLGSQFSISPADVALFLDILAGRKP